MRVSAGRLAVAGALVLAACGGDDEPEPAAEPAPAVEDDDGFDADDFDMDDLDDAFDEMREQLEELGQAREDFEQDPLEQDPDRPLLLPANVTITGDLTGTYTDNPGCNIASQYIDPNDDYHEGVLTVLFGWAGHTVDWTSDLPDDPRPLTVGLAVPDFAGGGTYDAFVTLQGVELWADGTAQVTIEEIWVVELPVGDHLVIEGSFTGSYAGAAGSGEVAGDLGVCNVPWS